MLNGKFALALAAAMVLATLYGCSSNSGIKNDRDEAITERDDALAAQMMAEQQRDDALDAQMMAQQERDDANTAKMMADTAKDDALEAQMLAQQERDDANTAKMMADTAKDDALEAQMLAEDARNTAIRAKDMAVEEAGLAEGRATAAEMEAGLAEGRATAAEMEAGLAEGRATAAEMEAGLAEGRATAAEMEARLAEGRATAAEDALRVAQATVSYERAYDEYRAANKVYIDAMVLYGTMPADVDEAMMLQAAAQAAMTAANNAVARATNGTPAEMAQANAAVTAAGTAVRTARAELEQAMTTMAAMPYAAAIKEQDVTGDMEGTATAILTQREGVKVTVMRGDTEIAKNAKARSIGNGWYVAEDVREETPSGATPSGETATVYTDIYDRMEKFTFVHNMDAEHIDSVAVTGVLTLATTTDDDIALFDRYADADAFPTTDEGLVTWTYGGVDDENTDTVNRAPSFAGTFDGIPGKFSCTTEAGCGVTTNSEVMTAIAGDWNFIPGYLGDNGRLDTEDDDPEDRDDTTVPSIPVPDDDYLRFGWWTTVETDDDTVSKVSFRTFYGGEDDYVTTDIDALEGSATYKGLAAGRYAKKTFNTNATLDSIEKGTFTADAELTASFGGMDIAESKQNRIEGVINNFKDERSNPLDGWKIVLTAIKDLDTLTGNDNVFMSDTVTGGVAGSPVNRGSWEGQFFGPNDTAIEEKERYPGSIAGKFDAHSSHGHVGGAFGAEKE